MAGNAHQLSVITDAVHDKIKTNQVLLGLDEVYWGDQNLIPRFPSVCVEPGDVTRTLDGTMRAQNDFTVFILVYLAKLQDTQMTSKQVMQTAEAVADVLESDVKLGGVVVFGHISEVTPGFSTKGSTVYRAARLTWQGLTRNTIGVN